MKKPRPVTPEQIKEWTENPVTINAKFLVEEELKKVLNTPVLDVLVYGEPDKTHENVVGLETRGHTWLSLHEVLDGDWSYFEVDEDEE